MIQRLIHSRLAGRLPILFLILAILVPSSSFTAAPTIEVVVENPVLQPPAVSCPDDYWYAFPNNRGHNAYLTLNTNVPDHSTNSGEWHPVIPQNGYYRVQAYIAYHPAITWCMGGRIIGHDTTDARYSIHYAYGVSSHIASQYPLSNQWLDLGEYYFTAGSAGYVSLTDFNGESEYGTTVSFSAMRFTFTRLTRPQLYLPLVSYTDPSGKPPLNVGVIQAQGFDACHLPSTAEMQTWWNTSPYDFYGAYIGGISLYSECAVASADWIRTVHQQGWSFVPIWVGLQAPCFGYKHPMSSDPLVAYQQGREEALSASSAAASLGFTNNGLGGTIIYYDMEAYAGNLACRQAVSAFMNGWVERLHELGNVAGGYGVACGSSVSDWSTIANVPDDVWPAYWYAHGYNPNASVFGVPCLMDTLWANHQRVRQYAGELNNTWGGVTLNIDIDVADGKVAMPPAHSPSSPVVTPSISIDDAGWLSATQGWLVISNRIYWTTDQGNAWVDISPAEVQMASFLDGGQAWALSVSDQGNATLYHTSNQGASWKSSQLALPAGSWWPRQMQFSAPDTGWLILQRETSQAFSTAILMKTSDRGFSWQTFDLPAAGKVDFRSPTEGWLMDATNEALYHSTDGGQSWQPAPQGKVIFSVPAFPSGSTLSGWQANGLSWAVSAQGACTGKKSTPDFVCQVTTSLSQSLDGGQTWNAIRMPTIDPAAH